MQKVCRIPPNRDMSDFPIGLRYFLDLLLFSKTSNNVPSTLYNLHQRELAHALFYTSVFKHITLERVMKLIPTAKFQLRD